jgi:hypothetical protein
MCMVTLTLFIVFVLVFAPNTLKLFLFFLKLWVVLTLVTMHYGYPITFHMICQKKMLPTLGKHDVILLTWKHFA